MRVSCNGCRALRKGCSDKCTIRPCLDWIKSPQPQANATLFLAKFYGRAGLINLLNAAAPHLRPAVFKSLLYDACGRIVNPVYGANGLLCSGNWHLCQAAFEAVLAGTPMAKVGVDDGSALSLMAHDIRHVSKDENVIQRRLRKVRARDRFKKPATKPKLRAESPDVDSAARVMWSWCHKGEKFDTGLSSRDSGLSRHVERRSNGTESGEADSASVETVEATLAKPDELGGGGSESVELELTLGLEPVA
ncbi:hypothetical protein CDL12_16046 [Handroanthus impetiginosus]|uniref:LOB domain-containing protein n=1 Tax=Handroanthus impetiginosus TaxID=429701 RepID=A0A2G9H1I3_9LAMI|nr:hypothetical protein CDL12_16046 [Handroanthus impetiginosus]